MIRGQDNYRTQTWKDKASKQSLASFPAL